MNNIILPIEETQTVKMEALVAWKVAKVELQNASQIVAGTEDASHVS
jgi:hypothetical protein